LTALGAEKGGEERRRRKEEKKERRKEEEERRRRKGHIRALCGKQYWGVSCCLNTKAQRH